MPPAVQPGGTTKRSRPSICWQPQYGEALNYRGYARAARPVDEGIDYYRRSVALDPRYRGREYLGEAFVIKGDMERPRRSCSDQGDMRH